MGVGSLSKCRWVLTLVLGVIVSSPLLFEGVAEKFENALKGGVEEFDLERGKNN